jgi:hypothetical protein
MTYRELAQARGITPESATRLAFRRKWRRQVGNDGTARVLVPLAEAAPAKIITLGARDDVPPDASPDIAPGDAPDITRTINALEEALSTLREQLERERSRCDTAESRAAQAETATSAETARAAAAEARLAAAEARTPWPVRVIRALRPGSRQ